MKLQPRSADFQGELAADASVDLRELLEATLHRRCALTVGDDVSVPHGDREFSLRVVEVSPDDANGAVSLVETDVEVDIAPSEDYEDAMRRLAEAEERRLAAAAAVEQERREREGFAREEEERRAAAEAEARRRRRRRRGRRGSEPRCRRGFRWSPTRTPRAVACRAGSSSPTVGR